MFEITYNSAKVKEYFEEKRPLFIDSVYMTNVIDTAVLKVEDGSLTLPSTPVGELNGERVDQWLNQYVDESWEDDAEAKGVDIEIRRLVEDFYMRCEFGHFDSPFDPDDDADLYDNYEQM